ncbi:HD domain-containing protein [Clostridium sardiniense]
MPKLKIKDIEHSLLYDKKPSEYFNELFREEKLNEEPLNELKKLYDIPQSEKHHPEGNVWNHTMMVVDNAAHYREYANDKRAFMWAALLHDIGKIKTTKLRKGRWTSYNHDNVGYDESYLFLKGIGFTDEIFIKKVQNLIKYHMHFLYITKKLPFGNEEEMAKTVDINDITLVFLCDRLGRDGLDKEDKLDIIASMHEFLEKYRENGTTNLNFIK